MEEGAKEKVLDMTWDYFKLLAQQRVTHFNLFIVFMGVISTVFATQIYVDLRGDIIACILATSQVFICFIFYKIDVRNKYLIKHTENVIKEIEKNYDEDTPRIFIMEEQLTKNLRLLDKKKLYIFRQLSTSQLYSLFYNFFVVVGIIELIFSAVLIILNVMSQYCLKI